MYKYNVFYLSFDCILDSDLESGVGVALIVGAAILGVVIFIAVRRHTMADELATYFRPDILEIAIVFVDQRPAAVRMHRSATT